MVPSKMKLTFQGSKKCYIIFDTQKDCGCTTCDSWTKYETIRFTDNHSRTYGIIALEKAHEVLTFDLCWDHEMRMNLISWGDKTTAKEGDLDLFVKGWKRDTKWLDTVEIDGKVCKISVEVYCPVKKAPKVYQQCYVRPQMSIQQRQMIQRQNIANQMAQVQLYSAAFHLGQDIGQAFFN